MLDTRESGLLLHITSLPGSFGIGELGVEARQFAADLLAMGQRWWQLLPVNPAGYAGTPYASPSAFAGHDLLIPVLGLVKDGLITEADLIPLRGLSDATVDFARVVPAKDALLNKAADAFLAQDNADFAAFCVREAHWLDDYALFAVLAHAYAWRPWPEWDPDLAARKPDALAAARAVYANDIARIKARQYLFEVAFASFRADVNAAGIRLIGDVPIFVSFDSADVWAHQDQFRLDKQGWPEVVTGVPPDCFSATGQRWGNPHFNWDAMEADRFSWWVRRIERAHALFDTVRIDHFLGFAAAYEIPASSPTAEIGRWVDGKGRALFTRLAEVFPHIPLIAEDLGVITPDVTSLRDDFDLPGMKILQFEIGNPDEDPDIWPANSACYTGTHDNNTIRGWFDGDISLQERAFILSRLGGDGSDIHWRMIEKALSSGSNLTVTPVQDLFGLGTEARMNLPGTADGNWGWRLLNAQLTPEIMARMKSLTVKSGRAS